MGKERSIRLNGPVPQRPFEITVHFIPKIVEIFAPVPFITALTDDVWFVVLFSGMLLAGIVKGIAAVFL